MPQACGKITCLFNTLLVVGTLCLLCAESRITKLEEAMKSMPEE